MSEAFTERLERRMAFALSVADQALFATIDGKTVEGAVRRLDLGEESMKTERMSEDRAAAPSHAESKP